MDGIQSFRPAKSATCFGAGVLLLLLVFALVHRGRPAGVVAQSGEAVEFSQAAQIGTGGTTSLDLYGSFVVLGQYGGLTIVDPSAASETDSIVGRLDLGSNLSVDNVVVNGTVAFLTTTDGRALVADLSDASHPTLMGIFDPPGDAFDPIALEIAGGLAFLVTSAGSLLIYDLGSLEEPRLLGFATLDLKSRIVWDLDIDRGHVYISAGSELLIVDVSDPSAPSPVAALPRPTSRSWYGLLIEEGLGYAAGLSGGLVVLDLHDPAAPLTLTQMRLPLAGGRAGRVREPVKLGHFLLFPAEERGLVSINVSDPADPYIESTLSLPGSEAWDVSADRERVFVIDQNIGLHVVDATDPSFPQFVRSLEWPGKIVDVHVQHGIASALSAFGRLLVYNVEDAFAPWEISRLKISEFERAVGLEVVGDRAYILMLDYESLSLPLARLQLVDLSDPAAPLLERRINISTNYASTSASCGNRLYFAGENGAAFFDLDGSGGLKLNHSWIEQSIEITDIACAEGWLYAISSAEDLEGPQLIAFDTSSSAALVPTSRQNLTDLKRPGPLFVFDSSLVVATADGIALYDISEPSMPVHRTSDLSTNLQLRLNRAMVRQGDLLYLVSALPSISAVDLGEPEAALVRGHHAYSLVANAVAVEGRTMVLGSGQGGITTVEISGIELPTPSPTRNATPATPATPPLSRIYLGLVTNKR